MIFPDFFTKKWDGNLGITSETTWESRVRRPGVGSGTARSGKFGGYYVARRVLARYHCLTGPLAMFASLMGQPLLQSYKRVETESI